MEIPKTRVILVRHGTSEWNVLNKWQGTIDTKLAPQGLVVWFDPIRR